MGDASKKTTQQEIENAFIPAREVVDAERFAGRRVQLERAHLALLSDGANIAILGRRGLGKSSLARQLVKIAGGETELLDRHKIRHDRKLEFLCFYHTCGNSVANTEHLLERLLTMQDCMAQWVYDIPKARRILEAYNPQFEAKVFGVGVGISGTKSAETTLERPIGGGDVTSVFTNVASAMVQELNPPDGVLVVIDEFDQIRNKAGFASFLKSLATNTPKVRFAIVGVAHDLNDLMKEHQSADRLFAGGVVHVPPMMGTELSEIVEMAQKRIHDSIVYHSEASRRLVQLAQGHPYMVHLLGKHSLRAAWQRHQAVISATDIDAILKSIAESGADPVLEGRYMSAIASSPQREVVLRAMAQVEKNGEIWTTDAYREALESGVDNASQYVGHLIADEYGAEIIKVRERYYRFRDSLFKAYVMVRPPQYAAVEEDAQPA